MLNSGNLGERFQKEEKKVQTRWKSEKSRQKHNLYQYGIVIKKAEISVVFLVVFQNIFQKFSLLLICSEGKNPLFAWVCLCLLKKAKLKSVADFFFEALDNTKI